MFVNKDVQFRPAGGGISCRVNDRVRRVKNTTYAVGPQTEHVPRWKPDSPAAAWYAFFFLQKIHMVNFL
jgi:hypothetical protein